MLRLIPFIAAALWCCAARAQPDGPGEVQEGRELATKACAACHIVRADQEQRPTLRPPPPSFEQIAQSSKADLESLRGFLKSTHSNISHPGGMPNPQLREEEIQKISAYIRSLRK